MYISILLTILLAAGIAAVSVRYMQRYQKNVKSGITLYITDTTDYADVVSKLSPELRNIKSFRKTALRESLPENLKSGRYTFHKGDNNIKIIRSLKYGWESPLNLVIAGNIRNIERLSAILGSRLMHDSTSFYRYLSSDSALIVSGFDRENFLSVIIPNTYSVYWSISPEGFLMRMKEEYDRFWTSEREEKAKAIGLSKQEVSVLASIVCEESNYAPELATIAGVYINRLKKGMKLDADPTVKYAHNDPSIKRILYKHLEIDSPYNTYKHYGLPPGPITIPQISGIDAVLNYEKHGYLYFCANYTLDGTHLFATSQKEHNINARKYQRAISSMAR